MDQFLTDTYPAYLKSKGLSLDPFYTAMSTNDLSDAVIAANNILDKSYFFKPVDRNERKSESVSNKIRDEGMAAYHAGKYQLALECYNKALAYSPQASRARKLAYGNRSALLCKTFNFAACLSDLEICLSMERVEVVKEKLFKRKVEVSQMTWAENLALVEKSKFIRELFKLDEKNNTGISWPSNDFSITEEGIKPKVMTTKEVKAGTVLGQEMAFSTLLHEVNRYFACYYCTMLSLNLLPCPGCVQVMFCSEDCKKLSLAEGHSIECQFIDIIKKFNMPKVHIALKSALKMKKMTSSWQEFVIASFNMGADGFEDGNANASNRFTDKFSLLRAPAISQIFVHGKVYYGSFACAIIMHYLNDVPCFFPLDPKAKHSAMCALMRVTMHMFLYAPPIVVTPSAGSIMEQTNLVHEHQFCTYPFMSKVSHSCHPNCIAVCLNNRVALVAIESIKAGAELTISQFGQLRIHDKCKTTKKMLRRKTYQIYGYVCECVCSEDMLTGDHKKLVTKHNMKRWEEASATTTTNMDIAEVYSRLCSTLAALSNVRHTKMYHRVYELFLKFIIRAQVYITRNSIIDFGFFAKKFEEDVYY